MQPAVILQIVVLCAVALPFVALALRVPAPVLYAILMVSAALVIVAMLRFVQHAAPFTGQ